MPIYEYVCRDCGNAFEVLVRGSEQPECPSCGQKNLARLLSIPAGHVAGGVAPPCPAKESGICGMQGCGGGPCGMM